MKQRIILFTLLSMIVTPQILAQEKNPILQNTYPIKDGHLITVDVWNEIRKSDITYGDIKQILKNLEELQKNAQVSERTIKEQDRIIKEQQRTIENLKRSVEEMQKTLNKLERDVDNLKRK